MAKAQMIKTEIMVLTTFFFETKPPSKKARPGVIIKTRTAAIIKKTVLAVFILISFLLLSLYQLFTQIYVLSYTMPVNFVKL